MRLEIPECRRCCLCVPLRYGIIIYGYLNLVFSILLLSMQIVFLVQNRSGEEKITSQVISLYKGAALYTQIWIPILLYSLEIFFNILLLVGAHKIRLEFIRAYYYYGLTTTLAAAVTFFIARYDTTYLRFDMLECCLAFSGFVIQAYLLLLIRSEFMKSRYQKGRMNYLNRLTELATETAPRKEPTLT